jgi:hypothetical protein
VLSAQYIRQAASTVKLACRIGARIQTRIIKRFGKLKMLFERKNGGHLVATDVPLSAQHPMYKNRPTLLDYWARRAFPNRSVVLRSIRFIKDNQWAGDFRYSVIGLPLGKQWITITDREGYVITAEGKNNHLIQNLELCQDQWDIFQQIIGRIFSLNAGQFETCSVLYRDGLPLDNAIEASSRL